MAVRWGISLELLYIVTFTEGSFQNPFKTHAHVGVGQNQTTRGPQVLVLGSIYQGKPFWVHMFDPQPCNRIAIPGTGTKDLPLDDAIAILKRPLA